MATDSAADPFRQTVKQMLDLHNEVVGWAWAVDPRAAVFAYANMLGGLATFYLREHPEARDEMIRLMHGLVDVVTLDGAVTH